MNRRSPRTAKLKFLEMEQFRKIWLDYLLPIAILFASAMHFWLAISGRFEPQFLVSGFAIAVLVQTHLQYKQQYDEDLEMFEQPITESLCEEQAKQFDDSPSYIRPVEGTVDCESFLSSLHAYRRLIMIGAGIPHEQLFQEGRSGLGRNSTRADVVEWQPGARSGVAQGLSPNQKEVLSDSFRYDCIYYSSSPWIKCAVHPIDTDCKNCSDYKS